MRYRLLVTHMSDQVELTNPVDLSVGGFSGHVFRRMIHVGMCLIPFAYFNYGETIAGWFSLTLSQFVSSVVMLLILLEALRLRLGITIFGQREYEASQISAVGWSALAIGIVLLVVPVKEYAWPLILSLALGDPLMGELRRRGLESRHVFLASSLFLTGVWILCWYWFETPLVLAFLFAPLCAASEWPRLRYIDDNATMLLIPMCGLLLADPFLHIL